MNYYRICYVGRKVAPRFDEFQADSDGRAVREAARLAGSHSAELWCGERRITAFDEARA